VPKQKKPAEKSAGFFCLQQFEPEINRDQTDPDYLILQNSF